MSTLASGLFQPHQTNRTKHFWSSSPNSLAHADDVLIAPVFGAREHPASQTTISQRLAERISLHGPPAAFVDTLDLLRARGEDGSRYGDVVLMIQPEISTGFSMAALEEFHEILTRDIPSRPSYMDEGRRPREFYPTPQSIRACCRSQSLPCGGDLHPHSWRRLESSRPRRRGQRGRHPPQRGRVFKIEQLDETTISAAAGAQLASRSPSPSNSAWGA